MQSSRTEVVPGLVNSRRTLLVVTGVVNTMLRSMLVLPVTTAPGASTHELPLRYWILKFAWALMSSKPVNTCALPTSIGNGKSTRAQCGPDPLLCQRFSLPATPSVR